MCYRAAQLRRDVPNRDGRFDTGVPLTLIQQQWLKPKALLSQTSRLHCRQANGKRTGS
jgi:hypothetical protein